MPEGLATHVDGCCAVRAPQLALAYWWIFDVRGVSEGSIFICRLKMAPLCCSRELAYPGRMCFKPVRAGHGATL